MRWGFKGTQAKSLCEKPRRLLAGTRKRNETVTCARKGTKPGDWRGALLFPEPPTTVKIGFYFLNVLILEITSHHFARAFGVRLRPRSALGTGWRCGELAPRWNALSSTRWQSNALLPPDICSCGGSLRSSRLGRADPPGIQIQKPAGMTASLGITTMPSRIK